MHILIEDSESLQFFTGDGLWSKIATEGRRYPATVLALRAAKQEPIGKFNIVGYVPETRQFVNLNHGRGKGAGEVAAA
jgi:hypothetical protein